jgi:hypothetical protein
MKLPRKPKPILRRLLPKGFPKYEHPHLDLGDDHWASWLYNDVKTGDLAGLIVVRRCSVSESGYCDGYLNFDSPENRAIDEKNRAYYREKEGKEVPPRPMWQVQSLDPLTISPSVQSLHECRDHGFIQNGKWVRA